MMNTLYFVLFAICFDIHDFKFKIITMMIIIIDNATHKHFAFTYKTHPLFKERHTSIQILLCLHKIKISKYKIWPVLEQAMLVILLFI